MYTEEIENKKILLEGPSELKLIAFNPTEEECKKFGIRYYLNEEEQNDNDYIFNFVFQTKKFEKIFEMRFIIKNEYETYLKDDDKGRWESNEVKYIHYSAEVWNFEKERPYKKEDKNTYPLLKGEKEVLEIIKVILNYPKYKKDIIAFKESGKQISIFGNEKEREENIKKIFSGNDVIKQNLDKLIQNQKSLYAGRIYKMKNYCSLMKKIIKLNYNTLSLKEKNTLEEEFLRYTKKNSWEVKSKDFNYESKKVIEKLMELETKDYFDELEYNINEFRICGENHHQEEKVSSEEDFEYDLPF